MGGGHGVVAVAQRRSGHRVAPQKRSAAFATTSQHRLHVGRRLGDDPQDVGRRRLLVERFAQLRGAFLDLLLQPGVGLLQRRGRAVELLGQRLQLVAGPDRKPMARARRRRCARRLAAGRGSAPPGAAPATPRQRRRSAGRAPAARARAGRRRSPAAGPRRSAPRRTPASPARGSRRAPTGPTRRRDCGRRPPPASWPCGFRAAATWASRLMSVPRSTSEMSGWATSRPSRSTT